MLRDRKVDVDEVWIALGRYGRFQRIQLAMWLYGVLFHAHFIMSVVFVGYVPEFECAPTPIENLLPMNESWRMTDDYTVVYGQCQIDVYLNNTNQTLVTSSPCVGGYKYDIHKYGSFVTEWDLVCDKMGMSELSQTILMIGKGVGSLVLPQLTDKYGRLRMYIICLIAVIAASVATGLMPSFLSFLVLRFVSGCVEAGQVMAGYILMLEMFPQESRMYVEVTSMFCWVSGVNLLGVAAYLMRNLSWRYTQIILPLCSSHVFASYWVMDESLRWLIANGKYEQAEKVLRKAARMNNVKYEEVVNQAHTKALEIEKMDDDGTGDTKKDLIENYTLLNILKDRRIFLNSLIIWIMWITVTLTYYGLTMASSSMLAGDRYTNYLLLGIIEYPVVIIDLFLFNRIGRKKLAKGIFGIAAVGLLSATIVSAVSNGPSSDKATLALSLIGKFGVAGAFSGLYLFTPEMYPTNMRNVGMGMAMMLGRVGAMLAPFANLMAYYIRWGPGVVFGAMCFLSTVLITFLPETSGRELPTTIEELKRWHRGRQIK